MDHPDLPMPESARAAIEANRELLWDTQRAVFGGLLNLAMGRSRVDRTTKTYALRLLFDGLEPEYFTRDGRPTDMSILYAELRQFGRGGGEWSEPQVEAMLAGLADQGGSVSNQPTFTNLDDAVSMASVVQDPKDAVPALAADADVLIRTSTIDQLARLGVSVGQRLPAGVDRKEELSRRVADVQNELGRLERRSPPTFDDRVSGRELAASSVGEVGRIVGVQPANEQDLRDSIRTLLGAALVDEAAQEALRRNVSSSESLFRILDATPLPEFVSLQAVADLLHRGLVPTPSAVAYQQAAYGDDVTDLSREELVELSRQALRDAQSPSSALPDRATAVAEAAVAVQDNWWDRRAAALRNEILRVTTEAGPAWSEEERFAAARTVVAKVEAAVGLEGTGSPAPRDEVEAAFAALGRGAGSKPRLAQTDRDHGRPTTSGRPGQTRRSGRT